ncbi:SHOCT domain-containing protein [Streptacidiphilus melanogenes]|uniref:SHOCT domain-containing protein n=1 Tax=Streptacidiphilus melanogenes TaxID=411235 RepID=UPI0005A777A5|nr:SHOCT domain-containing protein [Streptacidiphilus melanogenes]
MNTFLADGWHGGPGPWIFLAPLFWIGAIMVVRRIFWRGRAFGGPTGPRGPRPGGPFGGPRNAYWGGPQQQGPAPSPLETLNRRYADGEIDEFEYRQRLDVLNGTDTTA